MNYSVIETAKQRYVEYNDDYQKLVSKINLHLFSLARTNFNEEEKNKVWRGLVEHTENIRTKAEETLDKLKNIRFSESDVVLEEEKNYLVQKYHNLLNLLREEKATILRQMKKEVMPITPLWQKSLKVGYCYFCETSISSGFPYKLAKEEQKVLNIQVTEGAEFCSQECLLGYCKEYRNRELLRQEEEKKNKLKIENDRKLLTEIQTRVGFLMKKINELEKKERELAITVETTPRKENKGLFRWLGWTKDNSPQAMLENVRKSKAVVEKELEEKDQELQKALIIMSIDEQVEKERKKLEQRLAMELAAKSEKITTKGKDENDEE